MDVWNSSREPIMNNRIIKRAVRQLLRDRHTTGLGIILFILVIVSQALFSYYDHRSRMYLASIENKYPSEVLFLKTAEGEEETDNVISEEFINEVLKLPHIQNYNRTSIVQARLCVADFQEEPVSVMADLSTSLNSYFRSGQLELLMGRFPDETHGGALVDADYFGISSEPFTPGYVRLEFDTENEIRSADIPIVGVYKTIFPIEVITNDVPVRQNIIFLHESSVAMISNTLLDQENVKFFLDEHAALETTMNELKNMHYDHERFTFLPSLSPDASMMLSSIRMGEATRKMILIIYWLVSTGMVFVFLANDHLKQRKTLFIYFMLGERNRNIRFEYCSRIMIMFSAAFAVSAIAVPFLQPVLSKTLLMMITQPVSEGSFYASYELQRSILQHEHHYVCSWKELLWSGLYDLLITITFLAIAGKVSLKAKRYGKADR